MLKSEWKGEIDQNVLIWLKRQWSINMLKFESGNRSKSWNLSAKCQIDQNVEIWAKTRD